MTITPDHWLADAIRRPLAGGSTMPVRRFLVIHYTAGASAESSIHFWQSPAAKGASAHLVIERDGRIYQCRPFNRTAGHAGSSRWKCPATGETFTGLNACSIGIELANGGDSFPRKFSTLQPLKARHKHGGPEREWETYPAVQLAECEKVALALVQRYRLDDLIGHEDIAPKRKTDPGPAFPMAALRLACGFPGPVPRLS